jgi:hypothetical protein
MVAQECSSNIQYLSKHLISTDSVWTYRDDRINLKREKVRRKGSRIDRREAKQSDVKTERKRIETHASRQVLRQT